MEVCGIVLEIQGSSQALGVIWERCGIVRECWAGDRCQGQTRERTDFSTLPHPLAPSPALISASRLNPRVSHGGSPNSVPTTWQMGSLPRNPDTSLGPLLRVVRGRDVVGVPRHPCLPQCDQSLQEQPQFPRLLGDRGEHLKCLSSSCGGDSCLEFLIHFLLDACLKPQKSEGL